MSTHSEIAVVLCYSICKRIVKSLVHLRWFADWKSTTKKMDAIERREEEKLAQNNNGKSNQHYPSVKTMDSMPNLSEYQLGQLDHLGVLFHPLDLIKTLSDNAIDLEDATDSTRSEELEEAYQKARCILENHTSAMQQEEKRKANEHTDPFLDATTISLPNGEVAICYSLGKAQDKRPSRSCSASNQNPNESKQKNHTTGVTSNLRGKESARAAASKPISQAKGDKGSKISTTKVPRKTTLNNKERARWRQTRQEYEQSKILFSTKKRHLSSLIAQYEDLSELEKVNETNETSKDGQEESNINIIRRQISNFRPLFLESKSKMELLEKKFTLLDRKRKRQQPNA